MKVKMSKIHGSGIFALQDIKKGTRIIEYWSKDFKKEGDKRSERRIKKYLNLKKQDQYIFLSLTLSMILTGHTYTTKHVI